MEKYNTTNSNEIFVSPLAEDHGNGSREYPLTSLEYAISIAEAGTRIVLLDGTYSESITVQSSGTLIDPITIEADIPGKAVSISSWYLYDASDIIISGVTFKDISSQAISVIGNCERNSFNNLTFINCGTNKKKPCTLFFGGSGSFCNTIEKCSFTISKSAVPNSIAIIVTEGDTEENSDANKNFLIRENKFQGYGTAISMGTRDKSVSNENYSHIIESNYITGCSSQAIKIRCNDTVVRDNLIKKSEDVAIEIVHGKEQSILRNRISSCKQGIKLHTSDVSISHNCFISNESYDIDISDDIISNIGNISIFRNTFISNDTKARSIHTNNITIQIITDNIFSNIKIPLDKNGKNKKRTLLKNNKSNINTNIKGFTKATLNFSNQNSENYLYNDKIGAFGWAVEGEQIPIMKREHIQFTTLNNKGENVEELIREVDSRELYSRSFFINQEDNMENDEDQGTPEITDYSTWD